MNVGRFAWLMLTLVVGCSRPGQDPAGATAASATAAAAHSDEKPAPAPAAELPVLKPGESIGPVRLGMTGAELDKLGLPFNHAFAGIKVGPYRVMLTNDKVSFVEVELQALPTGIRIGDKIIEPGQKDIEAIAKHLPGCGQVQINEGGNVIECDSGKTFVKAGGPPGIVMFHIESK